MRLFASRSECLAPRLPKRIPSPCAGHHTVPWLMIWRNLPKLYSQWPWLQPWLMQCSMCSTAKSCLDEPMAAENAVVRARTAVCCSSWMSKAAILFHTTWYPILHRWPPEQDKWLHNASPLQSHTASFKWQPTCCSLLHQLVRHSVDRLLCLPQDVQLKRTVRKQWI